VDGVEKAIDALLYVDDTAVELPKQVPANQARKGLDRPDRATDPLTRDLKSPEKAVPLREAYSFSAGSTLASRNLGGRHDSVGW
jgi:hypothetical protein